MAIKILTKNSIDNTNIDGARQNHFSAGMKSGIIKGSFNEGRFFASATNIIALDTCELRISGHRVVIDSVQYFTLSNRPSNSTKYSMIAEISVNDNSEPTFRLFIQQSNIQLIKDNLFNTNIGSGTYQLEIGTFMLSSSGNISDVLKRAKMITGGSDVINVGTITTTTLEPNQEANVNVSSGTDDEENHVLNFRFEIPKGVKGDKGDRGEQGVKGDNGVASGVVLSNTYDNSDENGYTKRAVNNLVSNPNLLINGDFRVNQRGLPSYSGSEIYSVDRWKHGAYFSKTTINNNKVTFSISETTTAANRIAIMQTIEDYKECAGKIVTLSIKVDGLTEDVPNSIRLYIYDGVSSSFTNITGVGVFTLTKMIDMSPTQLTVGIQGTGSALNYSIVPEYMKLEIGSVATSFSPRPYAEELAMCQRYYLPLMNGASVYNGFIFTETNARISVPVPTTMRLRTPTAEFNVVDITQCKIYSNGAQVTPTALVYAGFVDSDQFVINATIPNATPNHACAMRLLGFASLDAEIY